MICTAAITKVTEAIIAIIVVSPTNPNASWRIMNKSKPHSRSKMKDFNLKNIHPILRIFPTIHIILDNFILEI